MLDRTFIKSRHRRRCALSREIARAITKAITKYLYFPCIVICQGRFSNRVFDILLWRKLWVGGSRIPKCYRMACGQEILWMNKRERERAGGWKNKRKNEMEIEGKKRGWEGEKMMKKKGKTFAHPNRLRIIQCLTIRNATGFRFEGSTQVIPLKIFYEWLLNWLLFHFRVFKI